MILTEQRYKAERKAHDYEYIHVTQEVDRDRHCIRFTLMESRWRSPEEAADYLRWAASEIEKLGEVRQNET